MSSSIEYLLNKRKLQESLRSLQSEGPSIDFCSNDYLGLARNKDLQKKISALSQSSNQLHINGATGSRLISGNSTFTEELEAKLAEIFKSESALLFNSGYTANMGVLSSIPQKGETVLYDELSHASIKDGIRLSFAERFPFKHNNMDDLESKLKKSKGQVYIVVESIYSMDGDDCPLADVITVAKKYNALIIVDEAHSTGVFGDKGNGLCCKLKLEKDIFIRIHTFGKAMGVHGACVAGSSVVKDFLINFSRPFIYTTALPFHSVASIGTSFEFLSANISLQTDIVQKITAFNANTGDINKIDSISPIQAVMVPGVENAKKVASILREEGFNVKPILAPTVKEGQERLRICLHTYNTDLEISNLTATLNKIMQVG